MEKPQVRTLGRRRIAPSRPSAASREEAQVEETVVKEKETPPKKVDRREEFRKSLKAERGNSILRSSPALLQGVDLPNGNARPSATDDSASRPIRPLRTGQSNATMESVSVNLRAFIDATPPRRQPKEYNVRNYEAVQHLEPRTPPNHLKPVMAKQSNSFNDHPVAPSEKVQAAAMMLIGARGKQETEEGTDMKTGVSNTSLDRMAAVDAIQQSLSSFTSAGLRPNAGASISTSPSNSASNSSKVEKGSVPLIVAQGGAHKMKGNRDLESLKEHLSTREAEFQTVKEAIQQLRSGFSEEMEILMRNITTTVDELNSLRTALDGTNQLLLKRKEPSADTEVKRQAKLVRLELENVHEELKREKSVSNTLERRLKEANRDLRMCERAQASSQMRRDSLIRLKAARQVSFPFRESQCGYHPPPLQADFPTEPPPPPPVFDRSRLSPDVGKLSLSAPAGRLSASAQAVVENGRIRIATELLDGTIVENEWPRTVTVDSVKRDLFEEYMPTKKLNRYLLGVRALGSKMNVMLLDTEFIKLLRAHPDFPDMVAVGDVINLVVIDKTMSRRLGDMSYVLSGSSSPIIRLPSYGGGVALVPQSQRNLRHNTSMTNMNRPQHRPQRQMLSQDGSGERGGCKLSYPTKKAESLATDLVLAQASASHSAPSSVTQGDRFRRYAASSSNREGNDKASKDESNEDGNVEKGGTSILSRSSPLPHGKGHLHASSFDRVVRDYFPVCIVTPAGVPFVMFVRAGDDVRRLLQPLARRCTEIASQLELPNTIITIARDKNLTPPSRSELSSSDSDVKHSSCEERIGRQKRLIDHRYIREQMRKRQPAILEWRTGQEVESPPPKDSQAAFSESSNPSSPTSSPRTPLITLADPALSKCESDQRGRSYTVAGTVPGTLRKTAAGGEPGVLSVQFVLPHEEQNVVILECPRSATVEMIKQKLWAKMKKERRKSRTLRYYLKVTGTSYFITEGETPFSDLPIIRYYEKKDLVPMLSLVDKVQSREEKLISKKIGLMVSSQLGPPSAWHVEDNDVTEFRIKMSQIIGDKELVYTPALYAEQATLDLDSSLPDSFDITVYFRLHGEVETHAKTLRVSLRTTCNEVKKQMRNKVYNMMKVEVDYDKMVLAVCGRELYMPDEAELGRFLHIRDCLQRRRRVLLKMVSRNQEPKAAPERDRAAEANASQYFEAGYLDSVLGDAEVISILTLKNKFEIKVISVENIVGSEADDVWMTVEVGIYHGGVLLAPAMYSKSICSSKGRAVWNEWLRSEIPMCNLPEESRVCVTVYMRKDGKDHAVSNVNCSIFDFKDHFRSGELTLRMWEDGKANPIGTCMENLRSGKKPPQRIRLRFHHYPEPVAFPNLTPTRMLFDQAPSPSTAEAKLILRLVQSDPLTPLTIDDKRLLWKYREYCRLLCPPQALVKVLACVDWTSIPAVREMYRLLEGWAPLKPVDALELLDAKFANRKVREYAVHCLDQLTDRELSAYLLQLVQVLKYEPKHFSPLAHWLLMRALHAQMQIGNAFFWHLRAEMHVPEIAERYALLLEMYLRGCGAQRDDLLRQADVVEKLTHTAEWMKTIPQAKRKAELRKHLQELQLPERFQLPLDPTRACKGFRIEGCKTMDSAKVPLWLVLENAEPNGEDVCVIFKCGDDLRQDALTLQMLNIMDKLWKESGLDLCLTPYGCVSTGDEIGFIETVLDSDTVSNIQKAKGGVAGAFKNSVLTKWLRERNPTDKKWESALDNFTRSCAGYCVATYVLGIGDRHNDNIMLNKNGFLFHIDFGHFLGHIKKFLTFSRERAPFVFTPEFAHVLGGKGSTRFGQFVDLCGRGYNAIRKHANVIINLFAMMLSTGIPELQNTEDIEYLRQALELDLTDAQASKSFAEKIYISLNTTATRVNFAAHIWKHR